MSGKEVPKRRAVIVGTNYEGAPGKFEKLEGAVHDAEEIKDRLEFSFEIPEKHFLIGDDATYDNIRSAINDLFYNPAQDCDTALFYFSGHGYVDFYGEPYIVPHNMRKKDAFVSGIKMGELKKVITNYTEATPGRYAIAILDCCHSGGAAKGDTPEFIEGIEAISGEGIFVLPSSVEDEKSREVKRAHKMGDENARSEHAHGAFTYCLIEGLDHGALDEEGKGVIYLDKLSKWVEDNIGEVADQEYKPLIKASGMSRVRIAECKTKYLDNLTAMITKAEKIYVDEEGWMGISNAIDRIFDVLELNPNSEKARQLIEKINNENLINYQSRVVCWFRDNDREIETELADINALHIYKELETLAYDNFPEKVDRFVKLDERRKTLLKHLCRVANEEISMKAFVNRCKGYDNPKSSIAGQKGISKTDLKESEKLGKVRKPQKNPDVF